MKKVVALLSGGLDSTLAVKLMIDQGFDVHAVNFTSAFCTCSAGLKNKNNGNGGGCKSAAVQVADRFGIPIKVILKGLDYIDVVRNPKHGYGKGINPCVDCRVFMFKSAKKYMEEIGAEFMITGEVLGQRPMSQRSDTLPVIEKESGLEGLILRPLSARHLPPTIAEQTGLVDREKLLDMTGRTRRPQMDLAEELEVGDYPCPSGGCLLTDKIFSKKVRDLLDHKEDLSIKDLNLLKYGRHFRYNDAKLVVSRNEAENTAIKNLIQPGDILIEPESFTGPVGLVCGLNPIDDSALNLAMRLVLRYASSNPDQEGTVTVTREGKSENIQVSDPPDDKTIDEIRVC